MDELEHGQEQRQDDSTTVGNSAAPRPRDSAKSPVSYRWWGEVPWTLASKSQLGRADLPREPGGPVRGWVTGRDFRGREMDIELYAVAEAVPTKASGGQLAAADRRRTATVRVCSDCGANCQQPLAERRGRYLCAMCAKLARIVDFQIELRERRAELAEWAQRVLADPALAVVWVEVLEAEPTPSGRRRPPLAARIHAVDGHGRLLVDVLVRLAGPRTKGAPAGAVPPEEGAKALQAALEGRRRITWTADVLKGVTERLAALGCPVQLGPAMPHGQVETGVWSPHRRVWPGQVRDRLAQWRGELDPATGELRAPWPPGTADRLLLCLQRIADGTGAGRPGRSRAARREDEGAGPEGAYEMRIAVTGPAGAAERLAGVLAAMGAAEHGSLAGPVPSREVPGAQVTYFAGNPEVLLPGDDPADAAQ
ncbi:hypothetical protein [Streptomyces sp. AgN23]|uniref:hypothetical protein n=1 Tax=Streptomyces sp. AgN23 TaxID=1188315 RepID=UPI001B337BF5|nr:hypothetical protein [Streptomyces sp. AgN23]QTI87211.1 hypothetical protein AS97_39610 [Streptomyces sp. AgN23]WTB02797.1 hypothetical protein OG546_00035 [Streptomyces antimycoticus]WTB11323.1 hypothetical protein OG546_49085 [Streptomyces antimycoticus]